MGKILTRKPRNVGKGITAPASTTGGTIMKATPITSERIREWIQKGIQETTTQLVAPMIDLSIAPLLASIQKEKKAKEELKQEAFVEEQLYEDKASLREKLKKKKGQIEENSCLRE